MAAFCVGVFSLLTVASVAHASTYTVKGQRIECIGGIAVEAGVPRCIPGDGIVIIGGGGDGVVVTGPEGQASVSIGQGRKDNSDINAGIPFYQDPRARVAPTVRIGANAQIYGKSVLTGDTVVEANAIIVDATVINSKIGANAKVSSSTVQQSVLSANAQVSRSFVEISKVGANAQVEQATVQRSQLGAGSITRSIRVFEQNVKAGKVIEGSAPGPR